MGMARMMAAASAACSLSPEARRGRALGHALIPPGSAGP